MRQERPYYIEPYLWNWRCSIEAGVQRGGNSPEDIATKEALTFMDKLFFSPSMPEAWKELNKRKTIFVERKLNLMETEDIDMSREECEWIYENEHLQHLMIMFFRCYEYHKNGTGKINYEQTIKIAKEVEKLSTQMKVALKAWRLTHLMENAWMDSQFFDITSEEQDYYREKDKNNCLTLPEHLDRIVRISKRHQSMSNRHVIAIPSKRYVTENILRTFCFAYGKYLYGTTVRFAVVILNENISIDYVRDIAKNLGSCESLYYGNTNRDEDD